MKDEKTPVIINGTVCNDLRAYLNSSVCEAVFDNLKYVLNNEDLDDSTNINDYIDSIDWNEDKYDEFYDYVSEALIEKLNDMDAKETVNKNTITFNEAYYRYSYSESYTDYNLTLPVSWEEISKEFESSKEKNKHKDEIER